MRELSGKWQVALRFISGEVSPELLLEQEGEVLKGLYRSTYGEYVLHGSVRHGVVQMQVGIYYQGVGVNYSFQGQIESDRIKGAVDLGEYWEGVWEARRVGGS